MHTISKIILVLLVTIGLFALTHFVIQQFRAQPADEEVLTTKPTSSTTTQSPKEDLERARIKIGAQLLNVEFAKTATQKEQGLSGRKALADNEGMLFDFSDEDTARPIFWMKDMLIDLDIIWIKDYTVVEITKNITAPPPGTPDGYLERYQPDHDIDSVLEVRSGWTDQYNIHVGDTLSY